MKKITASDLVDSDYDTLVADNREQTRLPITGEVFDSYAMRGFVGIETPFGVLYVPEDETLIVED